MIHLFLIQAPSSDIAVSWSKNKHDRVVVAATSSDMSFKARGGPDEVGIALAKRFAQRIVSDVKILIEPGSNDGAYDIMGRVCGPDRFSKNRDGVPRFTQHAWFEGKLSASQREEFRNGLEYYSNIGLEIDDLICGMKKQIGDGMYQYSAVLADGLGIKNYLSVAIVRDNVEINSPEFSNLVQSKHSHLLSFSTLDVVGNGLRLSRVIDGESLQSLKFMENSTERSDQIRQILAFNPAAHGLDHENLNSLHTKAWASVADQENIDVRTDQLKEMSSLKGTSFNIDAGERSEGDLRPSKISVLYETGPIGKAIYDQDLLIQETLNKASGTVCTHSHIEKMQQFENGSSSGRTMDQTFASDKKHQSLGNRPSLSRTFITNDDGATMTTQTIDKWHDSGVEIRSREDHHSHCPSGSSNHEKWLDGDGRLHRVDGPAEIRRTIVYGSEPTQEEQWFQHGKAVAPHHVDQSHEGEKIKRGRGGRALTLE